MILTSELIMELLALDGREDLCLHRLQLCRYVLYF
jgi:hypothetical protein